MAQVIAIKQWDELQHYKDRDPTWVKLYRDLLSSESWVLGTDASRLVQVASILLAARYRNATPFNYDLFRKVANLDLSRKDFDAAITHLIAVNFLEIQGDIDPCKQGASNVLADCYAREEKRREEERREEKIYVPQERDGAVESIFDHWRTTHGHQKAKLDRKRRKVIATALQNYSADDLRTAISGYLNSPHHMGVNDRATRYDDIELFLRDAKHIDAGINFAKEPPRTDLSATTRRNVAAIADWMPPETRNAGG